MRNQLHQFVVQEDDARKTQQDKRRRVKQRGAPTTIFEQVIANRIDRAEVEEQWRRHDETRITQECDGEIEIAISAERSVKVIDKRRQTEAGKVHHEGCAAALLEDDEQTDEEIDDPDQIDVEIARGPTANRAEIVQVGVVVTSFGRIRRPLNQVVNLMSNACLIQVDLNLLRSGNLFAPVAGGSVFTLLAGHADRQQAIAGNHTRQLCGRSGILSFADDGL